MKQTIAQQIKWDFKTNGDLIIQDTNGNGIYIEDSCGYWVNRELDSQGKVIYFEDSGGGWSKYEYDSQGNEIYVEGSSGFWAKSEYDSQGNCIYYETSNDEIIDLRLKPCENKVVEIDGEKFKLVKV